MQVLLMHLPLIGAIFLVTYSLLLFDREVLAEDHGGKSRVHHGGASVDNSSVVQRSSGTVDRTPTNHASTGGSYVAYINDTNTMYISSVNYNLA